MILPRRQARLAPPRDETQARCARSEFTSGCRGGDSQPMLGDSMRLAPGVWFKGEFLLEERLGRGGAGEVWRVLHRPTQRRRALKILSDAVVRDPHAMRRFELEACVGGMIDSPHLVDIISAGVDSESGRPWLLMEPLTGETLADWIAREGPLPLSLADTVLSQLAEVLSAAHRANVIHRDIKPPNLFIEHRSEGPFLRLLDFGVAKVMRAGTLTGEVGTPTWMAPEQMDLSTDVSPATDVWGFGLTAFYVFVGHHYWRSQGFEIVTELVHEPYPRASQRALELDAKERLPPGFDEWFERCVARDSRDRFIDVAVAERAFRPLLAATRPAPDLDRSGAAHDSEERVATGKPARKVSDARSRWGIALLVMAGVLLGGAAVYFGVSPTDDRTSRRKEDRASERRSSKSSEPKRKGTTPFSERETIDRARAVERIKAAGIPFSVQQETGTYLASFACNGVCCTSLTLVDAITEHQFDVSMAEYARGERDSNPTPGTMAHGSKGRTMVTTLSVASTIPPDPRCKAAHVLSLALGE